MEILVKIHSILLLMEEKWCLWKTEVSYMSENPEYVKVRQMEITAKRPVFQQVTSLAEWTLIPPLRLTFLAHQIKISMCFTCAYKSYLTHVISHRTG